MMIVIIKQTSKSHPRVFCNRPGLRFDIQLPDKLDKLVMIANNFNFISTDLACIKAFKTTLTLLVGLSTEPLFTSQIVATKEGMEAITESPPSMHQHWIHTWTAMPQAAEVANLVTSLPSESFVCTSTSACQQQHAVL